MDWKLWLTRPHKGLRALYDWVLSWADTPFGTPALFVLAVMESSFFPIPPDVLLIALSAARPKRAFFYAAVCTVGSVLGGILGYAIGYFVWDSISDAVFAAHLPGFSREVFARVQGLYQEYDFWAVFAAGFTPIPYKVFTIAAGVFGIGLGVFVLASIFGRGGRFFLVAGTLYFFGAPVKAWLEKYFDAVSIALLVLLIGGFIVLRYAG